jgi:hypothetical protein
MGDCSKITRKQAEPGIYPEEMFLFLLELTTSFLCSFQGLILFCCDGNRWNQWSGFLEEERKASKVFLSEELRLLLLSQQFHGIHPRSVRPRRPFFFGQGIRIREIGRKKGGKGNREK